MAFTSLLRALMTRSFKPFVFESAYRSRLDFEGLEGLGLYVHIPFCRELCDFCPYCKEAYDAQKAASYKRALLAEIDLVCGRMTEKKRVGTLYFGGGTPALMLADLPEIIERLKRAFIIEGGIGIELHPDDIDERTLQALKDAGVTMLSVGVQSFDEGCRKRLGRRGGAPGETLRLVRDCGFDAVDVDLIFAIPGQTERTLLEDVEAAFEYGATQVSTYPFMDFTFADNAYKPMGARAKKRMLRALAEHCQKTGMHRSSVWTFARGGAPRYSSVTRDAFLGFGVSAVTLLKDSFKLNTFSVEAYAARVGAGELPTSLTIDFTRRQRAAYYLFWRAYSLCIDADAFEAFIGAPLERMFGLELLVARSLGLIEKRGRAYHLTDRGAYAYHRVEQAYTTAYIDKMWNVSRLRAFPERIELR